MQTRRKKRGGQDGASHDARPLRSLSAGGRKIRYGVIGLGYISQVAVLPAFAHAKRNSELVALFSEDAQKLAVLSKKYKVPLARPYEDYEACLRNGEMDAVYIALPNNMHAEFAVQAARAGVHVLCEKPMAVTEDECRRMISEASRNRVKLMIAYRLHLEAANLEAVKIVRSGRLGDPRIFSSVFTMQVKEGNIRLRKELGGGTLYDIGIYCINAARYLFQAEPTEVFAFSSKGREKRFEEVDEMTTAVLRFPDQRLASFTCSFGAADVSSYQIVGTKGDLRVDPAYEFSGPLTHRLTLGERTRKRTFAKRDQFGPELLYFSRCILEDEEPEPSGTEGLIDVHIIRSLYRSADTGVPIELEQLGPEPGPGPEQRIDRPAVRKPELVHANAPSE